MSAYASYLGHVANIGTELELRVDRSVRAGLTLWGTDRVIDVVLTDPRTSKSLGIACQFHGGARYAGQLMVATMVDMASWPMRGIVAFEEDDVWGTYAGYFTATGRGVGLEHLGSWLKAYFALDS